MKTVILQATFQELADAIAYHNSESLGLGYEFADEILRTIDRVAMMPNARPVLSERTRRCIARRFPYGTVYEQRPEKLILVSVMHLHRNPNSWKNNLIDK